VFSRHDLRSMLFFCTAPETVREEAGTATAKLSHKRNLSSREASASIQAIIHSGFGSMRKGGGWVDVNGAGRALLTRLGMLQPEATTRPVPPAPPDADIDAAVVRLVTHSPDRGLIDRDDIDATIAQRLGLTRTQVAMSRARLTTRGALSRIKDGAELIGLKQPGTAGPSFDHEEKPKPAEVAPVVFPEAPAKPSAVEVLPAPVKSVEQWAEELYVQLLEDDSPPRTNRQRIDIWAAAQLGCEPTVAHQAIDWLVFRNRAVLVRGANCLLLKSPQRHRSRDRDNAGEPTDEVFTEPEGDLEGLGNIETEPTSLEPDTAEAPEPAGTAWDTEPAAMPISTPEPAPVVSDNAIPSPDDTPEAEMPAGQDEESSMVTTTALTPQQFAALAFIWSSYNQVAEQDQVALAVELDLKTLKREVLRALESEHRLLERDGTRMKVTRSGDRYVNGRTDEAKPILEAMEARGLFASTNGNGNGRSVPPPPRAPAVKSEPAKKPHLKATAQVKILVFLEAQEQLVRSNEIKNATGISRSSTAAFLVRLSNDNLVTSQKVDGRNAYLYGATEAAKPYLAHRAEEVALAKAELGLVEAAGAATATATSNSGSGASQPEASRPMAGPGDDKLLTLLTVLDAHKVPVRRRDILPECGFTTAVLGYYLRQAVEQGFASSELVPGQQKDQQYEITAEGRAKAGLEQPGEASVSPIPAPVAEEPENANEQMGRKTRRTDAAPVPTPASLTTEAARQVVRQMLESALDDYDAATASNTTQRQTEVAAELAQVKAELLVMTAQRDALQAKLAAIQAQFA